MVMIRHAANVHDLVGHDIVGVLSPCQQFDDLRVAVGDEFQFVFHHKGRVQVVRVDSHAQEREKAVFGRDDFVVNLSGTLAVKVETERGGVASAEADGTDFQIVAMRVVDSEFVRGRAQRGENGVKQNRVCRKLQFQVGIGVDLVVLLAGLSRQKKQQKSHYEEDRSIFHGDV